MKFGGEVEGEIEETGEGRCSNVSRCEKVKTEDTGSYSCCDRKANFESHLSVLHGPSVYRLLKSTGQTLVDQHSQAEVDIDL